MPLPQTETLQETVIDSLRNRVAAISEAKKLMREREKTRLDYAAYLRNVRNLKAKGDRGDKLAAVRARATRGSETSAVRARTAGHGRGMWHWPCCACTLSQCCCVGGATDAGVAARLRRASQKERKLDKSRETLGEQTADVFHECDKFEALRPTLFLNEFRAVRVRPMLGRLLGCGH